MADEAGAGNNGTLIETAGQPAAPTGGAAPAAPATPAAPQQTPAAGAAPAAGTDPATQTPPADGAANADASKDEEPQGAPEAYENFTTPEGYKLDEDVVTEFKGVAKELNLSQANAQKLIDKLAPKIAERNAQEMADTVKQIQIGWANAAKTDKEFGGDKLDENLAVAKRALDTFATPELRKMLNETRLGDNPEVVRLFYRVGKNLSEDGHVTGNKGGTEQDLATKLYPSMNKE